jgi:hypothetical protein
MRTIEESNSTCALEEVVSETSKIQSKFVKYLDYTYLNAVESFWKLRQDSKGLSFSLDICQNHIIVFSHNTRKRTFKCLNELCFLLVFIHIKMT